MDENLKLEIDKLLIECQKNGSVILHSGKPEIQNRAIHQAKAMELIKNKHRNAVELTKEGLKVINIDGIDKYLKEIKEKEGKKDIIENLTIKQLKGSIFQVKYWWLILLLSGVIGFITGNFELILKWLN